MVSQSTIPSSVYKQYQCLLLAVGLKRVWTVSFIVILSQLASVPSMQQQRYCYPSLPVQADPVSQDYLHYQQQLHKLSQLVNYIIQHITIINPHIENLQ